MAQASASPLFAASCTAASSAPIRLNFRSSRKVRSFVCIAIGNSPNPLIRSTTEGLEANKKGCIIVDDNTLQTTREGVYAGGDAVTGAATVILAMGAGKHAAKSIDEYIQSKADQ